MPAEYEARPRKAHQVGPAPHSPEYRATMLPAEHFNRSAETFAHEIFHAEQIDPDTNPQTLAKEILEFHGEVLRRGFEAARAAVECGRRLNLLRPRFGYGEWAEFTQRYLPDISATTQWRYRQIADRTHLAPITQMYLEAGLIEAAPTNPERTQAMGTQICAKLAAMVKAAAKLHRDARALTTECERRDETGEVQRRVLKDIIASTERLARSLDAHLEHYHGRASRLAAVVMAELRPPEQAPPERALAELRPPMPTLPQQAQALPEPVSLALDERAIVVAVLAGLTDETADGY